MSTLAFRTVGLTAKLHLQEKNAALSTIVDVLRRAGADIRVDAHTVGEVPCVAGLPPIGSTQDLDLLIAVGGDGTILRTIRELQPDNVPILAINAGSVGFLSEFHLSDVATKLPAYLAGSGQIEHRSAMCAFVVRGTEEVFRCIALNDVVISQGTISRLLDLEASVGDRFLATYHADGLIVATPTGSTAYSLAAGGPVVHPTVSALILTPINPHSFTQKPIVIPGDASVSVTLAASTVPPYANVTVGLTIDGQVYHELRQGDEIVVRTDMTVHFLRGSDDAFYRALRTKLKWGEGLDD